MDEIYPPETYGASIRFPLKGYFEEFNNIFSSEVPLRASGEHVDENRYLSAVRDLMGVDLDLSELKELSQTCSIDLLTSAGENVINFPVELPSNINSSSKIPFTFFTPTEPNSTNVYKCRSEIEMMKKSVNQLLYGNKRSHHKIIEFITPSSVPPDLSPGSDFIVAIQIFRPFAFKYFNAKNASEKLRFNHEIVALGRNTLTELRDTIICSSDDGLCKEVQSTSDDLRPLADAKSKYPSGFIFIDNVFYNDFRDPDAIDYSTPILEWAKEKKLKNLQSKSMEDVRIDSLTPRFGYPYLYMHQGDCEHLLVFSDAKLLDHSDCLHSQCYPHVLKLNRKCNRMCFLCSVAFAKWICVGSNRFPQNKVFLCTDCCNAYNYSKGEKIGNFKLYPYYEKHVVM